MLACVTLRPGGGGIERAEAEVWIVVVVVAWCESAEPVVVNGRSMAITARPGRTRMRGICGPGRAWGTGLMYSIA